jgi:hypothetical protein
VTVRPAPVGTGDLDIGERTLGIENLDAGSPADGHTVQAQAVIDDRSRFHRDGRRCRDLEAEERRGDPLEVEGVGEERKDLATRSGHELGSLQEEGH